MKAGRAVVRTLALLAAALTGAAVAALGGRDVHVQVAVLHFAVAAGALFQPRLVIAQVGVGQFVAAGLLLSPAGPGVWGVLGVVAGVVLTAELLGEAARLDVPGARGRRGALVRPPVAAALGGGVYALVAATGMLPSPAAPLALTLALAACAALALLLARAGLG